MTQIDGLYAIGSPVFQSSTGTGEEGDESPWGPARLVVVCVHTVEYVYICIYMVLICVYTRENDLGMYIYDGIYIVLKCAYTMPHYLLCLNMDLV